jgi:hypothetical protein
VQGPALWPTLIHTYIPAFGRKGNAQIHRHQGELLSLLSFFKISGLKLFKDVKSTHLGYERASVEL